MKKPALSTVDLETILTGKSFADLPASPLQVGIARAAEGRATGGILSSDELARYFGTTEIPALMPRLLVIVAGVRGGKSFLASCAAIRGCLRVELSHLKAYEVPRFAIVAPRIDAADATFKLLLGILRASPILRTLIEGEPTSDTVVLRRPDGRLVEIVVCAAAAGGITVRNRWLAGFVLEEVASFATESTGAVVNAEELLRAGETRLLPGAQGWLISSPFGPQGLLWQLWQAYFGRPSQRALVIHAPTRSLNPSFPEEQIEAIRRDAPDVAAREYDAAWVDAEVQYLATSLIDAARRDGPAVRPPPGFACAFGMDAGTRGNAWTLAGAWRDGQKTIVAITQQWIGSKLAPLSPDATLAAIAKIVHAYGSNEVLCDRWSFDANRDIASKHGLRLIEIPSPAMPDIDMQVAYAGLKTILSNGALELPPDPVVRADLMSIKKKATANAIRIELARTPDGRHSDYAPSIALACTAALQRTAQAAAFERKCEILFLGLSRHGYGSPLPVTPLSDIASPNPSADPAVPISLAAQIALSRYRNN